LPCSEKIGKINQIDGVFKGCQRVETYTGRESVPYIDDSLCSLKKVDLARLLLNGVNSLNLWPLVRVDNVK